MHIFSENVVKKPGLPMEFSTKIAQSKKIAQWRKIAHSGHPPCSNIFFLLKSVIPFSALFYYRQVPMG
jgi:hypothetical protein